MKKKKEFRTKLMGKPVVLKKNNIRVANYWRISDFLNEVKSIGEVLLDLYKLILFSRFLC